MRILTYGTLRRFGQEYAETKEQLDAWHAFVSKAGWANHNEMKADFPKSSIISAERVVFDIKGTKYRLIVSIVYKIGWVYIRWFGPHAEYDKIDVKTIEVKP